MWFGIRLPRLVFGFWFLPPLRLLLLLASPNRVTHLPFCDACSIVRRQHDYRHRRTVPPQLAVHVADISHGIVSLQMMMTATVMMMITIATVLVFSSDLGIWNRWA